MEQRQQNMLGRPDRGGHAAGGSQPISYPPSLPRSLAPEVPQDVHSPLSLPFNPARPPPPLCQVCAPPPEPPSPPNYGDCSTDLRLAYEGIDFCYQAHTRHLPFLPPPTLLPLDPSPRFPVATPAIPPFFPLPLPCSLARTLRKMTSTAVARATSMWPTSGLDSS